MGSKLQKLLKRERWDALAKHPTAELAAFLSDVKERAGQNRRALEQLERRNRAGETDEESARFTQEKALLHDRVARDEDDVRAVETALATARKREEDAAGAAEARALEGGLLRNKVDALRTLEQAVKVERLQLEQLATRLASDDIRRSLTTDPTVGIRPQLIALLGDRMPTNLRSLFEMNQPLPLHLSGPRDGERRRVINVRDGLGHHPTETHDEVAKGGQWTKDERGAVRRQSGRVSVAVRQGHVSEDIDRIQGRSE